MPFIHTMTSKTVTADIEAALRRRFGEAITCIPGKSEAWLMLAFSDGRHMAFRGTAEEDCVMLEVSMLGSASDEALSRLTATLTDIVCKELCVRADHVYIKYAMTDYWGYNGENF